MAAWNRSARSRRVGRLLRLRRGRRHTSAAVTIQALWRGCSGRKKAVLLCARVSAARALQRWLRRRLRARHFCARIIALNWLRAKKGRMIAHLRRARAAREAVLQRARELQRDAAAVRLQAVARGTRARKRLRRQLAAIALQKVRRGAQLLCCSLLMMLQWG